MRNEMLIAVARNACRQRNENCVLDLQIFLSQLNIPLIRSQTKKSISFYKWHQTQLFVMHSTIEHTNFSYIIATGLCIIYCLIPWLLLVFKVFMFDNWFLKSVPLKTTQNVKCKYYSSRFYLPSSSFNTSRESVVPPKAVILIDFNKSLKIRCFQTGKTYVIKFVFEIETRVETSLLNIQLPHLSSLNIWFHSSFSPAHVPWVWFNLFLGKLVLMDLFIILPINHFNSTGFLTLTNIWKSSMLTMVWIWVME